MPRVATVRIEFTSDDNLAVCEQANSVNTSNKPLTVIRPCPLVKACIQRAVAVQPRHIVAVRPVILCKHARNQNFRVRLQPDHSWPGLVTRPLDPSARIESDIHAAI